MLVADLENQTGDELFDRSLLTAFTIGLEESRYANVYPRPRAGAALRRMGTNSESRIDEALGREICLRDNIKGLIVIAISKVGHQYAVSARLIDPRSGVAVRSYLEKARHQDQILNAVGKVANRIRRDLGESMSFIQQDPNRLPLVTTPSLQALRLYTEGNRLTRSGQYKQAIKAYEAALDHDPEFAMAHAALGGILASHLSSESAKGKEHYEAALRSTSRITAREKLLLQAEYHKLLGRVEDAVQYFRLYLDAYPDDAPVRHAFGTLLMENRFAGEAAEEFRQAIRIDPFHAHAMINLASSYRMLDRLDEAMAQYAKAFALQPGWITFGNLNHEYGFAWVAAGDLAKAREVFGLAIAHGDSKAGGLRSMALLHMYAGRYREARARLTESILLSATERQHLREARSRLYLAILLEGAGGVGAPEKELDRAAEALRKWPNPAPWLEARIGAAYARAGAVLKATQMWRRIDSQGGGRSPSDIADLNILEGEIALAQGRDAQAVEKFQLGARFVPKPIALAALARAHRKAGRLPEAAGWYEKLLATGHETLGWEPQQSWLEAHVELAELRLAGGDVVRCSQLLGTIRKLWKDADSDLPLTRKIKALEEKAAKHSAAAPRP